MANITIEKNLTVAMRDGVQLATDRTDFFNQARFNIHMNIFQLGSKYSEAMGATVQDDSGQNRVPPPPAMILVKCAPFRKFRRDDSMTSSRPSTM